MEHLDENALTAYVSGDMPPAMQSQVRAHLDTCEECRAVVVGAVHRVHTQRGGDDTLLALGSNRPATPIAPPVLARGAHVGPYVIEHLLGAGGMGCVYAARDARLDRTVALKLIRQGAGHGGAHLTESLRRESKALARLSHPNVTTVYELDSANGEIYIAMEYVDGMTLRAWLATHHEPADVLAKLTLAGRGLAAAHAAGLVHRDFKPDNVLLGNDGSVKVTDFGLAKLATDLQRRDHDGGADVAPASSELTRTGTIVGTPRYMAPEQFRGVAVDARADQFAFCLALYEGLVGRGPWTSTSFEELSREVNACEVEFPRTSRVSPRVRRALLRGLARDPGARFASMPELLAALEPPRRTKLYAIAGGAIATAAIATTVLATRSHAAVCEGASEEVAAVWNPARRDAIARAFTASRAPDVASTWTTVEHNLDAYFDAWAAMQGESCKATRVHGQQSEAVLDLRTACLQRRRSEVDALLDVLEHADAEVVAHAREAVGNLPSLASCADVEALVRRTPLPTDPELRRHHDQLRTRLDAARAYVGVAQYAKALPLLDELLQDAKLVELPALEAEAHHMRAKVLTARGDAAEAEAALHKALVRAQASRADDLVAFVATDLAYVISSDRKRSVDAQHWVDFAAAAIVAKGGDELLAARLETVHAGIFVRHGELAEAEAANRKALAIATRKAPGSALEAEVHDALGTVLSLEGKLDEAVAMFEKSATLTEQVYGPTHSLTAAVRMNLANALGALRRYPEARTQYETALAIREALFGADNLQVAMVLSNLGQVLQEAGNLDEARGVLERALAIRIAKLGPDAPPVARTAANLGYLFLDMHEYQRALDQFTRAVEITSQLEEDDPMRADALTGTGLAWIGLGKPENAIAPLSRAVELAEHGDGDPVLLASMRASLGRALHASGRDLARAAKLGAAAREVLAKAGEDKEVAEIDAWLRIPRALAR